MVRVGIVVLLLGIPGLIILPLGVGMIGVGGLLMAIGLMGNTAKAGVGVGSFAVKAVARQVTTKACPECRSDMPRDAIVCLACGYRESEPVVRASTVAANAAPEEHPST